MRHIAIVIAFIVGACAGTVVQSAADELPDRKPAPVDKVSPGVASVVTMERAEHRQVGGGKAEIWLLAQGKNAFFGRLDMAPNGKVPTHRDATEEIIHVLHGGGTISIDGKVHQIKAGTTVYMPANAEVSFSNGPEQLVALQVFAGPGPAAKYNKWQVVQ